MLSLYEILKASKTGIATDMWTALAGKNWGGAGSGAKIKELTGIPPLSFTADGTSLLDYLISGNMSQTGTPTPDNPIQPSGCGERTENLFDKDKQAGNIYVTESIQRYGVEISVEAGIYTVVGGTTTLFVKAKYGTTYETAIDISTARIITLPQNGYILIYAGRAEDYDVSNIMLNTGSTALPYEPYGYKIPISSGGENLFDMSFYEGKSGITVSGNKATGTCDRFYNVKISIPPELYGQELTWSVYLKRPDNPNTVRLQTVDNGSYKYGNNIAGEGRSTVSFTATSTIRLYINYANTGSDTIELSDIMLNRGSTPIPYEPYGIKIPISSANTTTPVYLGEVETTRQIKKLVLTGEEGWQFFSDSIGSWQFYINNISPGGVAQSSCVSNIAPYGVTATTRQRYDYGCYLVTLGSGIAFQMKGAKDTFTGIAAWKSYLAAQYANGTPVTVWYVLATPTTGIVNEPLRKIGNYADTVSMEQAGVRIPTNRGNTVIDVLTELKPSEMYIKYQE